MAKSDELRSNRARAKKEAPELDSLISFMLPVLFGEKRYRLELPLVTSIFDKLALVNIIPRRRPTLATIVDVEKLLIEHSPVLFGSSAWRETLRIEEKDGDGKVRVQVSMSSRESSQPRTADALFVADQIAPQIWKVVSCTLVYDEESGARSPITLTLPPVRANG